MSHRHGTAAIDESERRALAALVEDRTGHDSGDEDAPPRAVYIPTTLIRSTPTGAEVLVFGSRWRVAS